MGSALPHGKASIPEADHIGLIRVKPWLLCTKPPQQVSICSMMEKFRLRSVLGPTRGSDEWHPRRRAPFWAFQSRPVKDASILDVDSAGRFRRFQQKK